MSSTLIITKTPVVKTEYAFKAPVKAIIARKFYDHDGSLGGGRMTIGPEYLEWFEGVLAGACGWDEQDYNDFSAVVRILRKGGTIDMQFAV